MTTFIHPWSLIPFSSPSPAPTPQEVIGLTSDSVWAWFLHTLGWHEPALTEPVKRIVRKRFESVPFHLRRLLLRPALIPHRNLPPDSFTPDSHAVRSLYRLTASIRRLAVRNIHRFFRDPSRNRVDRYHSDHQLWLPEAELDWLRMRSGMRTAAEGKLIDFPISLRFGLRRPQHDTVRDDELSRGELRTMTLHERAGDGYWPIRFYSGSRLHQEGEHPSISFNREQTALGIDLPHILETIGYSWIENASWGPKNRVLFKKVCSDEQIGILLWPSFPHRHHPTPRIPVYYGDIVQLVDGDQLLIFVGTKRGLKDVTIQITITAQWASSQDPERTYADRKYVYPNPCERYPYCVQRPIYQPVISLDPVELEGEAWPKSEYNEKQAEVEKNSSTSSKSEQTEYKQTNITAPGTVNENEIINLSQAETNYSEYDESMSKDQKEINHNSEVEIQVQVLDEAQESNHDCQCSRSKRKESTPDISILGTASSSVIASHSDSLRSSSTATKRKRDEPTQPSTQCDSSSVMKRVRRSSGVRTDNSFRSQTSSDVSQPDSIRKLEIT